MSRRRVLICGATGFIGRNMAERFAGRADCDVLGICHDRPPYQLAGLRWMQADLTDASAVDRIVRGVDVIVQAAATTSGVRDTVARPHVHVTDNAVMNSLLFRAAHEHRVGHVVWFSCTVMYPSSDRAVSEMDFDASAELHPRYFGAGWTKIYLEKMCEFYARQGATRYTAIRHSNVYGPHDKFDLERSHVFGATVTKVMTATDGRVVVWGTGEEGRDLLYVDDLVACVERAVERQSAPFGLYNCGYGEAIRVKDLVARIVAASGRDLRIEHDLSQPSIGTSLFLDCRKAERDLGWRRQTGLDEGIARTLDWWRHHVALRAA